MKIKKLPNSKRVVVEFDEWLRGELQEKHELLVAPTMNKMNELAQRRTSYNMWEFTTEEEARQALFMLGLKL
jgi:hypothetical protein